MNKSSRRSLIKNKKGQSESIVIFFGLAIATFIVAIIILRIVNAFVAPFSTQLNATSSQASQAVDYTHNTFTSAWDWAIVLAFLINVIVLLVSSFLVDIHPAFLIIYVITIFFMFLVGNYALSALDAIWGGVGTSVETAQMPITIFILNHFQMIMLGIVILSGVLMYAKFKFFAGQGGGGDS